MQTENVPHGIVAGTEDRGCSGRPGECSSRQEEGRLRPEGRFSKHGILKHPKDVFNIQLCELARVLVGRG